jgi:hypothetical protein
MLTEDQSTNALCFVLHSWLYRNGPLNKPELSDIKRPYTTAWKLPFTLWFCLYVVDFFSSVLGKKKEGEPQGKSVFKLAI